LDQAKSGHGQIVGVMGEPGLGKSRLFYEFKLLSQAGCFILEAYSVSHGKAAPYLPVLDLLKSYFDIQPQDEERKRRERVIGKVLGLERSLEDTLPYLFALLGIEEQPSPLQQMDPQVRRKRTFEALKKLFLCESLTQPLILIFEDLHWIDSETQGLLDILSEGVASTKLLLLVNYRPEYRHEWGQKTYYTQVRLTPFGQAEAEEFLDELLGSTGGAQHTAALLPLKYLIMEKTEGTPFFMEEVVQELFEQGMLVRDGVGARPSTSAGAVPLPMDLHIPTTVQGVLAARIDRLAPDEKALLQQLAVIGREFPLSLVRQVVAQPEDELYRLLSSLQHKEFLYEQPAFPETQYLFKHALTLEVAYSTVLQDKRKALHERTARAIESLYRTKLEDHYSTLAHHYSRSGNAQKAVAYLHLAGQQAVRHSAYTEAITHLTTALDLLKTLPDTPECTQQELDVQTTLGPALIATRGYTAPEVERTYRRAHELCLQVGETPQLANVLWALCVFHFIGGKLQAALDIAEQYGGLAERTQQPALLLETCQLMGAMLLNLGDLRAARPHLERGVALYDPQQHHALIFAHGGADTGVAVRTQLALLLWQLGYPSRARAAIHDALTLARKLAHPFSLAFTPINIFLSIIRFSFAWVKIDKAKALENSLLFARHENQLKRIHLFRGG
jgi:predicted ATPase